MNHIECFSPNDQKLLSEIPVTPTASVTKWMAKKADRIVPLGERVELLKSLSKAIVMNAGTLEQAIIEEGGKTAGEAAAETAYAATFVDAACSVLEAENDQRPDLSRSRIYHAPLGIALLITAFNDPIAGITRKLGPALAAGCPVVVKPSPLGALCARLLQESMPDAFGDYVLFAYLNDNDQSAALVGEPGLGVVSLTGSTGAGRAVGAIAGSHGIPCILELGGNCPFVVFADADLDRAALDILDRKTRAAGQACSAVNRVLVDARVIEPLLERVVALLGNFSCGLSIDPEVKFGPVRTMHSLARLEELKARCLASGGVVVGQGKNLAPIEICSTYPLTVVRSKDSGPLSFEEAFGPLLSVQAFSDNTELDSLLSPKRQNLAAYFYGDSADTYLAERPAMRFGSIGINTTRVQGADIPSGGFWQAGHGREGGVWGLNGFRTTINLKRGS